MRVYRAVANVGEFPWLICPHCQSTNIVADGEYVCRDCGTVLGPVPMPPVLKQTPVPVKHEPTSPRHVAARYRPVIALEGGQKER